MPKIIHEKFENGVLVERKTEGSNTTPWHWVMLFVHSIAALSLAVIALLAVYDALTRTSAQSDEDPMPARCEQAQLRS